MFCFRSHMPESLQPAVDDELRTILRDVLERLPPGVSKDAAVAAVSAPLPPGFTYDVGRECPRDDLYYRLAACRVLQRLKPPELAKMQCYR